MFTGRLDDKGNVCRFKTHLVANGFSEKEDFDDSETFVSVVPYKVLLLPLGKFMSGGWHIHHEDSFSVCLNRDIVGNLYASWYSDVYKLKRGLHGLKQSQRPVYEELKRNLEGFGFEQRASCKCEFKIKMEKFHVGFLIHVEDLVILGCAKNKGNWVEDRLGTLFNLTDVRGIKRDLDVMFDQNGNVMIIHQEGYCRLVLERFGMDKEKPALTPMVENIDN